VLDIFQRKTSFLARTGIGSGQQRGSPLKGWASMVFIIHLFCVFSRGFFGVLSQKTGFLWWVFAYGLHGPTPQA